MMRVPLLVTKIPIHQDVIFDPTLTPCSCRNVSDVEDTHQRICLHAELLIPHLRPVMSITSQLHILSVAMTVVSVAGSCVCLPLVTQSKFSREVPKENGKLTLQYYNLPFLGL